MLSGSLIIRRITSNAQRASKRYHGNARDFWGLVDVGLNNLLGVQFVSHFPLEKKLTLEMGLTPSHLSANGLPHGGSISTLGDTCVGFAAWLHRPLKENKTVVTNISTTFLKPGKVGQTLVSTSTQLQGGSLVQVWQTEIRTKEEGNLVAFMTSSVLNLLQDHSIEDDEKKLDFFSKNKSKFGFSFNVEKMTKEEIAQKFDKHAPNWCVCT
eukprot:TRINITY_DN3341_c0_g2_i1.p2 TRINITY_DN3341_c0_g2~~TRINITY_DN3341_c0_g2_i1.p2  ORF type:complete len:211 (-),score=43.61 TRINITY_DN3341_c0_g2_i1:685-1317(-)